MNDAPAVKKRRGRPRKSQEELRRDHSRGELANLDVWLMVESKRKGLNVSVARACELIVEEAKARRAGAPKVVREMLDQTQKYLFDAGTLRRRHARADTLCQQDPWVAAFLNRELARLGPWESTTRRRYPGDS
jgi:hypothetical protein